MKQLRIWFMQISRRQIPAPAAAALLLLVIAAAVAWVCIDSSTAGLPPPGAPGRYDAAIAAYGADTGQSALRRRLPPSRRV